jgi:hypothetical protein
VAGFAELSAQERLALAPFLATVLAVLLLQLRALSPAPKAKKRCASPA